MEENKEINFSEFEDNQIKEIRDKKIVWFGEKNLPFKRRFYQFIATVITVLGTNFMTKRNWQVCLVIYLIIVCTVGTYTSIKYIINLL